MATENKYAQKTTDKAYVSAKTDTSSLDPFFGVVRFAAEEELQIATLGNEQSVTVTPAQVHTIIMNDKVVRCWDPVSLTEQVDLNTLFEQTPRTGDLCLINNIWHIYTIDQWISLKGDKGDTGTIFIPFVDPDTGDISWTNNGSLVNPTKVNIRGPKGEQGLTGDQGPKGDQGLRGYDFQYEWKKNDLGEKTTELGVKTSHESSFQYVNLQGPPVELTVGETKPTNPGQPAQVEVVGEYPHQKLNFTIPTGQVPAFKLYEFDERDPETHEVIHKAGDLWVYYVDTVADIKLSGGN